MSMLQEEARTAAATGPASNNRSRKRKRQEQQHCYIVTSTFTQPRVAYKYGSRPTYIVRLLAATVTSSSSIMENIHQAAQAPRLAGVGPCPVGPCSTRTQECFISHRATIHSINHFKRSKPKHLHSGKSKRPTAAQSRRDSKQAVAAAELRISSNKREPDGQDSK
jgi:hypothetical protein